MTLVKKHIVIVSAWFLPQKGVAVNRISSFARYLDKSRYNVSVIALWKKGLLHEEVIEGVKVFRAKNTGLLGTFTHHPGEIAPVHLFKTLWNVLYRYIWPIELFGWKKEALNTLMSIHQSCNIDLLISSSSPVEAHILAFDFCSQHPEVKWIADMRDELSRNPNISKKQIEFYKDVEGLVNKRASAFTTVSEPILNDFRKLMPDVPVFEEVRNGFDHQLVLHETRNDVFTIAYGGTFYGSTKPDTFFEGVKKFTKRTNAVVKVEFIGTPKNFNIPGEFISSCAFLPQVEQQKLIEQLASADATLLVIAPGKRKGVYSGKLFDYLSVKKPVIALVDKLDVAARLINELNAGFVADFNNIEEIESAIYSAYRLWKENKKIGSDDEKIKLLHRKYQVKKLEKLIDKILLV